MRAGSWAMRGPQKRRHYYLAYSNGLLKNSALCGANESSFAYSITVAPGADACKRCLTACVGQM